MARPSLCGRALRTRTSWCRSRRTPRRRQRATSRTARLSSHQHVIYFERRMKSFLFRLVATLLLGGQMLPHGLPLLCDQVQRGTPADCEQMPPHPSAPAVDTATQSSPCINAALCAATATAVVALLAPVAVSTGESL